MYKSTNRAWWLALGLLIALAVSTPLLARDYTDAFVKAQGVFERGLRGSKDDNENAAAQFKRLTEQEPGNPLFMAYYGATSAIKAQDAWMPWTKIKFVDQGLELVDKALKQLTPEHDKARMRKVPVSMETRLVAINTFFKVPNEHFHRYDAGNSLLAETMKSPLFAASPPQLQARFHFQAAFVAQTEGKRGDEANLLKRVLELDPESADAPAARARLKELGP